MTIRLAAAGVLAALLLSTAAHAEEPVLKAGVQAAGTVLWELDTIEHYGLDARNGFDLQVEELAGAPAAQTAFLAGEVDVIVSDWLWVARQRAEGMDLVFLPYSKAVGGLMVPADSPAQTLKDLAGGQIGIAGGPVDKSWLILRAYAQQEYGMDLQAETEQVFGAPPLIYKTALSGDVAGAINFWHFQAKMEAAGMRELVSVSDAAQALGLDPDTPLLGYVLHESTLAEHPGLAGGLAAASREAKAMLASDDSAWERIRPIMNAGSDEEFAALKAGFLAGTPAEGPVDEAAADRMLRLMAELGGEELVGSVTSLPEGVFVGAGG
ncbi:ABC transporter substrate-binding protein [Rubellimicrobium mesophilum DSM 19309]|uniref:ABC transporter substrate-binding protein n=1 Tax=Rubellimicrobium mesophilum DSM 19309 TaxID=442562 RepID=A0A017HMC3_9RHOB|nr:ABC transporter substrate-binding protein [Rubellimicrobium mesophilum]EYD74929.1 ABC transporter substrate-binding protein [Rubellimicrobium mesophilum DSM 19309]